ncbi:MAG: Gfo/Idh/MocA family oxidoreductase [Rhizobiaceae bacterium]
MAGNKSFNGKVYGWAIIGTGHIAERFARDLKYLPRAKLRAVLSRDLKTAEAFAMRLGVEKAHADMDALLSDKSVDIVYVASPNSVHLSQALRVVRAGKHVLVEKPVVPSEPEVDVLAREAARNGVFAMEAMWVRFLPGIAAIREAIAAGVIGEIERITGSLSWKKDFDAESRFFSKALGGGASLDLGVYLLSLSMHLLGEPMKISGRWDAAPTGVDMSARYTLHYKNAVAELVCGFDENRHNCFEIAGTKGTIRISDPFIHAERIEIASGAMARRLLATFKSGIPAKILARLPFPGHRILRFPLQGTGLSAQADAVMQALDEGKIQHPLMPLRDSAAVLRAIHLLMSHAPVEEA